LFVVTERHSLELDPALHARQPAVGPASSVSLGVSNSSKIRRLAVKNVLNQVVDSATEVSGV